MNEKTIVEKRKEKDPDYSDKHAVYQKAYYQRHLEAMRAYNAAYQRRYRERKKLEKQSCSKLSDL